MVLSTDSSAPLVAVIGATGLQGGSVVNSLVDSDQPYRIRGLTRDASSAKAKSLAERHQGLEVVTCNVQPGNEDEIKKAFEGAAYIFVRRFCPTTSESANKEVIACSPQGP
jgi:uncharacterized protein YbjT (DUF2867 family)